MVPKLYGIEHILYLIISTIIGVVTVVLIKKYCTTEKSQNIAIKIFSIVLLLCVISNRIFVALKENAIIELIPGSYCGVTSFTLGICGLFCKKNSKVFHCVVYVALLGATLTMIYPDFLGQNKSFFYGATITGLLHHSVMLFLAITMLVIGYIKPCLSKWYYLFIGLCFYIVLGEFEISVLGFDDAMHIHTPMISDTIFYWYFVGILFLILHFFVLLGYTYFSKKIVSKKSINIKN